MRGAGTESKCFPNGCLNVARGYDAGLLVVVLDHARTKRDLPNVEHAWASDCYCRASVVISCQMVREDFGVTDVWAYQRDILKREIIRTQRDIDDMKRGRLRVLRSQGEAPAWDDDTSYWSQRSEDRHQALSALLERFD